MKRQDHRFRTTRSADESGQATVELAVILPFIALMLLCIIQVVLIGRSQLALQNAVREAARQCAVNPGCDSQGIVDMHINGNALVSSSVGTDVVVEATSEVPIIIPGLQSLTSLSVSAQAVMRSESG